ncbi:hypothetical protein ANRL2_02234 [Anaerolineae bacterium]|nr:hypothetical protein ANRL2_02234 [Anaerolineae bacterium]
MDMTSRGWFGSEFGLQCFVKLIHQTSEKVGKGHFLQADPLASFTAQVALKQLCPCFAVFDDVGIGFFVEVAKRVEIFVFRFKVQ